MQNHRRQNLIGIHSIPIHNTKPNGLVFYFLLYALLLTMPDLATGQHIRLPLVKQPGNLYLDASRLFNYNIYEGSRWGAGLLYTHDLNNRNHTQLGIDGYLGYGTADQRYKYGCGLYLRNSNKHRSSLAINYLNDIEQIASRSLNSYNIVNIEQNSHYYSSRYNAIQRIGIQLSGNPAPQHQLTLGYAYSHERPLYNHEGPIYPTANQLAGPLQKYNEWTIHYRYSNRLQLRLTHGNTLDPDTYRYLRLIGQYERQWRLENNDNIRLYIQGGASIGDVPLSRMFDLSGTAGSHIYFTNTFLTIRPNTLMTDRYAMAGIRHTCGWRLYDISISKPQPFWQLNGMWGHLSNSHTAYAEWELQAPEYGILEPAIGLHNILCIKGMNIGAALAYQIDIEQLAHDLSVPATERIALMISATVAY